MKSSGVHLLSLGLVAAASFGTVACSDTKKDPPPGELVVALQSDMKLPADIDTVGIQVSSDGQVALTKQFEVGPGGRVHLPGTIGVLEKQEGQPAEIRIWAKQKGKIRVLRDAITIVPHDRVAYLPMPMQWLCDGTAIEDSGVMMSSCGVGKTCKVGWCEDAHIDSSSLPEYKPELLFGGASDANHADDGACFDATACFADAIEVAPTTISPTQGSLDISSLGADAEHVNVALQLPPGGDGICDSKRCLIILDRHDSEGWKLAGQQVELPKGVLKAVAEGRTLPSLLVTGSCATKTQGIPLCGPWSSVGGGPNATVIKPGGPTSDAGSDASEAGPGDGGFDAAPKPCPAATPGNGRLCVDFDWENVTPSSSDPTLDLKGSLFAGLYATTAQDMFDMNEGPIILSDGDGGSGFEPASPVAHFWEEQNKSNHEYHRWTTGDINVGASGKQFRLWSVFFDNDAEKDSSGKPSKIMQGGAFVGGLLGPKQDTGNPNDRSPRDLENLMTVTIKPGESKRITLHMWALRRLKVGLQLQQKFGNNQGWPFWLALSKDQISSNPPPNEPFPLPVGWGIVPSCSTLQVGQPLKPLVPGVVIGTGKKFIAGALDAYGEIPPQAKQSPEERKNFYMFALPGTITGTIWSGKNDVNGSDTTFVADPADVVIIKESDYEIPVSSSVLPKLDTPMPAAQIPPTPLTCN